MKEQEGERRRRGANPSAAGGGRYKIDRDSEKTVIDVHFSLRQVGSSEVVDPINPARAEGVHQSIQPSLKTLCYTVK